MHANCVCCRKLQSQTGPFKQVHVTECLLSFPARTLPHPFSWDIMTRRCMEGITPRHNSQPTSHGTQHTVPPYAAHPTLHTLPQYTAGRVCLARRMVWCVLLQFHILHEVDPPWGSGGVGVTSCKLSLFVMAGCAVSECAVCCGTLCRVLWQGVLCDVSKCAVCCATVCCVLQPLCSALPRIAPTQKRCHDPCSGVEPHGLPVGNCCAQWLSLPSATCARSRKR